MPGDDQAWQHAVRRSRGARAVRSGQPGPCGNPDRASCCALLGRATKLTSVQTAVMWRLGSSWRQQIDFLQFVHTNKYVYRDIKPDNFMLGGPDAPHRVFAIDLGAAEREFMHNGSRQAANENGTPTYMSRNTHNAEGMCARARPVAAAFICLPRLAPCCGVVSQRRLHVMTWRGWATCWSSWPPGRCRGSRPSLRRSCWQASAAPAWRRCVVTAPVSVLLRCRRTTRSRVAVALLRRDAYASHATLWSCVHSCR